MSSAGLMQRPGPGSVLRHTEVMNMSDRGHEQVTGVMNLPHRGHEHVTQRSYM